MSEKNMGRLAQDMKRELIAIISRLKDPRLAGGLLTVTRLDVTPDLDVAKVYVSVLGKPEGPAPVIEALMNAGVIQGDGSDPVGNGDVIDLSHDQVRLLVFSYRGGAFDARLKAAGLKPAVE